jgi:lia operon protein LiaG
MFNNLNIKKFTAYTAMTMIAAFVLSALIFFSTGGVDTVVNEVNKSKQNINIEKVIDVAGINCISVDTSSTDVHFIPENRSDIEVHLSGYVNSGEPELTAEQDGDTLNVYTRNNNNDVITIGFNISDLKLDIYLPDSYTKEIKMRTSSGNVILGKFNVENFTYDASSGNLTGENFASKTSRIETSSGNVKLSRFGGDLELKTSSGDASIEYSLESTKANITTSSGRINLMNFTGDLDSRAQSGDIKVDYAVFNNKVNMKSSSGEVQITLPIDSQFGINVSTSSGDIRTDFSVAQSGKIDEDNLQGTVGNSSNQITINTSSGNVKIKKK